MPVNLHFGRIVARILFNLLALVICGSAMPIRLDVLMMLPLATVLTGPISGRSLRQAVEPLQDELRNFDFFQVT